MKFTRIVYGTAAAYGFISLVPLYFMLERVGSAAPPAITHPEFYYGFIGLALLWQAIFVLISANPVRYRPIMPITILEKFIYTVPVIILYSLGRVSAGIMWPSLMDPIFGILFIAAYIRTTRISKNL